MKPIKLKQSVTEKDLMLAGFSFTSSGMPYRYKENEEKTIIIVREGEEYILKWRYQSQEGKSLINEIGDILDLFDIEDKPKEITVTGLNELAKDIHKNAVAHGWWEEERSFGEIIALIHSEVSEALEEYRNGNKMHYKDKKGKPEGVAVELVDVIIRVLDFLGKKEVDVETLIKEKHEYNKKRDYKHGNKVI